MLVDSWYDSYLGVVVLVRIIHGVQKRGSGENVQRVRALRGPDWVFRPEMEHVTSLGPEKSLTTASIKQVRDTRVGDTITHEKKAWKRHCRGSAKSACVACGLFLWTVQNLKICAMQLKNWR